METDYIFREITKDEIPQMFSLILQRMKWMDQKGIQQWNITKYNEAYPQSYYEEKRCKGEIFVLADRVTNEIVGAASLQEHDERWKDNEPSIYLHHFVTKLGTSGAGSIFLQFAEKYAIQKGKKYLRLDSPESNYLLAQYYQSHGFLPAGTCERGLYKGVLRQKQLLL